MKKFTIIMILCILFSILMAACKPDPQTMAMSGVSSNEEWGPYVQSHNGVEMVLVPAGCFMMGNEADTGGGNSTPVHEQCFNEPFWIDRTEVTNDQFGSHGKFSGDARPREEVAWFDAQAHCAKGADQRIRHGLGQLTSPGTLWNGLTHSINLIRLILLTEEKLRKVKMLLFNRSALCEGVISRVLKMM